MPRPRSRLWNHGAGTSVEEADSLQNAINAFTVSFPFPRLLDVQLALHSPLCQVGITRLAFRASSVLQLLLSSKNPVALYQAELCMPHRLAWP